MKPLLTSTALILISLTATAAETFWMPDGDSRIVHTLDSDTPVVLCMQGQQVVMQTEVDADHGLSYLTRFFEVPENRADRSRVTFQSTPGLLPRVIRNRRPWQPGLPESVAFDGRLILTYPEIDGLVATRTVFPSTTEPWVLEHWTLRHTGGGRANIRVYGTQLVQAHDEEVDMVWTCEEVRDRSLKTGETLDFAVTIHARPTDQPDPAIDLQAAEAARCDLAEAAWSGPGRLETPEPRLDLAFALQKLHVLESPIETLRGRITHNGSLTYSPGVWANDPVEYSSPLFPFFGDATLNEASMNMYRIWLDHIRKNGLDPFPGSFEHATLDLTQKYRGDDAMVLYGLSKFLLFLGDRAAAEEMWPLVEFSAKSVRQATREDGIVASKTDEMEGRYPTGDANLSTSSLAYGGYRLAADLGRSLGRTEMAEDFDRRADGLRTAIEKYFGATVEGFDTYRYYDGNTTLRGWILLPLAMGITERREATLDAMVSPRLWPNRLQGGDILAESTRETEWGRETYYALRTLFLAGRTELGIDTTRRVVDAQILGPRGPYPDEDAIDMLCPGSLHPRAFIEGLFGIVPTGLDAFECSPWLPEGWPRMALRDLRAFGCVWDLVVERAGDEIRVTITRDGETVLTHTAPQGTTHAVDFGK
jgi:hypothetical protein